MTLNTARVRKYLKDFDFEPLFIEELGWDRHAANLELTINGQQYPLRGFAEKRGVQVFECRAETPNTVPDFKTQRKIETQLRRAAREHLVIYTDATKTKQVWKPVDWRGHEFYPGHQWGDSLIGKLQAIQIPLDEEEALDLLGTVHKLRDAFDRDRITKRFYDYFQREHKAFLEFIEGIPDQGDREWYASLMLNRLMFVYFIQKKGFLDRDTDYLLNRLKAVQSRKGKGKFQTFYRYFLLTLFHQGFSTQPEQRELDSDLKNLLGDVPYLNGGLFDVHELEQHNPKIDIPDEAFERIFDFFDQYEWTLDTRPLRNDREINPDVLGYIFEKYINQKQMGAYYTKEDITGYISRNTVIPYLFDEARKKCTVAFQPGSALWRLLQDTPDRYIYPAVRKGVIDDRGEIIPLPAEIEKGIEDVAERDGWNRPAGAEYALPTETWREYVARRQRCLEVRQRLTNGDISQINDLITYNLDIRRFAEDAILSSEGPELLRAFYQAITGIAVLDPTCGSGALLFAALNILEPLYEACLDRMQTFLEDLERGTVPIFAVEENVDHPVNAATAKMGLSPSQRRASPEKFKDFRAVLKDVAGHPNTTYFILKSIIVRNLYGVDLMEEAVEICKLRLFLKLVSQVENVAQLEPLPDIDFNIRPGNTLVGFTTLEDVKRTILGKLADNELKAQVDRIVEEAEIVDRAFQKFHEMQTVHGMNARDFSAQKQELRSRLDRLSEELDRHLAGEYGVDPDKPKKFQEWQLSHQPFHWFAEFFGIMRHGGFDVIIGNPPWVEKRIVQEQYKVKSYFTETTNNLYAYVTERSISLLNSGRLGFIVPLSSMSTDKFSPLQEVVLRQRQTWLSNYDDRPSRLFEALEHVQPTIILTATGASTNTTPHVFVTRCYKWSSAERPTLFSCVSYASLSRMYLPGSVPKVGTAMEVDILNKLWAKEAPLGCSLSDGSPHIAYYTRKVHAFLNVLDFVPTIRDESGKRRDPSEQKTLEFSAPSLQSAALCTLNSTLFRWFLATFSDCRNLNRREVLGFPIDLPQFVSSHSKSLCQLATRLSHNLRDTSEVRTMRFGSQTLRVQCIVPKHSKPIIDEIDRSLAQHYDFTDEELDFIINYDIKYRMGQDDDEEDE